MPDSSRGKQKPSAQSGAAGGGLFSRLLEMVLGGDESTRQKKRQLRQIEKTLSRSRQKLYKPRQKEALPGLARMLYDMYRVIAPASQLLSNAADSEALRQIMVEQGMSPEQRELAAGFSEESIRQRAKTMDTRALADALKQQLQTFVAGFDHSTNQLINQRYTLLKAFSDFVRYDWFFTLRKFDSSFREGDPSANPSFEAISGEYICDDLKDLMDVMFVLDKNADWAGLLDALAEYRGVEVVDREQWRKLLSQIDQIRKSGVLVLIVRHLEGDPAFNPHPKPRAERIVQPYLERIRSTTEATIRKLVSEKREARIEQLVTKVFGTSAVSRSRYYTDKANLMFAKKAVVGYQHTQAFNYLKAFLVDYAQRDIREVHDLLSVRGKWSTNIESQKFSDAFYEVMDAKEKVVKFDEDLADEGDMGQKVRRAMGRVMQSDRSTAKTLNELIEQINASALAMIHQAASGLIGVGKQLKVAIEDHQKPRPELLLNWKELENQNEADLKQVLPAVYTRIFYFVQLMQMFVKPPQPAAKSAD